VQYNNLTENQAKQLYDTLSTLDVTKLYKEALQGERVLVLNQYQLLPNYPLKYGDQIVYLDLIDRQMRLSDHTYREAAKLGFAGKSASRLPFYAPLSKTAEPVSRRSMQTRDKALAEIAGSKILMALQAYHDRFGKYPASINELRSKLRWEIPIDPFSGRDFIYRQTGSGFIFYSINFDMKDDGGKTLEELQGTPQSRGQGDLVWKTTGV
jgi:hypothetical protein